MTTSEHRSNRSRYPANFSGTLRVLVSVVVVVVVIVFSNLQKSLLLGGIRDVPSITDDRHILLLQSLQKNNTSIDVKTPHRTVTLIHVGKTGGETVRHTLSITCQMRKNPEQKQLCIDYMMNRTESILSQHTVGTFHGTVLYPPNSLSHATTYLWTIRNPIDRIISWFAYMNPVNCNPMKDDLSTACNVNRTILSIHKKEHDKRSKWAFKFFRCFPSITAFATALDTYSSMDSCSQIAWRTIRGNASETSGHAYYNYAYYCDQTKCRSRSNEKELWVIRTESLWQDLKRVEDMFEIGKKPLTISGFPTTTTRNITHGSEGHVSRDILSTENVQRLCCALMDEILIYRHLLFMATN